MGRGLKEWEATEAMACSKQPQDQGGVGRRGAVCWRDFKGTPRTASLTSRVETDSPNR